MPKKNEGEATLARKRSCRHPENSPYRQGLDRGPANWMPLTPLAFLERTADIFPERTAVVSGAQRFTYAQFRARCRRLASALEHKGVRPGDTVAFLSPNSHALVEAHYGVPMAGAVLNALNTRLDADTIAYILEHGEAKLVFCDTELAPLLRAALALMERPVAVVDIVDPAASGAGERLSEAEYEDLLAAGDPDCAPLWPEDEWQAIALNYTSGTTGRPKGVVYHHRGAWLTAVGNTHIWEMGRHPVWLWTVPMFHCNGWCFPWTTTLLAGTHVCLRKVDARAIFDAIAAERVTHLGGAPVIMAMMANLPEAERAEFSHAVRMMTAASAPPAAILERMDRLGIEITHVYGLTETYGPATVCALQDSWRELDTDSRAGLIARQGVRYPAMDVAVLDTETLASVPADATTMGEIMMRGNDVMMGYLKNPEATAKAFAGGWFRSGDLAVLHEDGYLEIKDRSKDIIISGGENVSSIEVEGVLYRHPAVAEAAVVAMPDERWGEVVCAFVGLQPGQKASEADLIAFCRARLAGFKTPKRVVFGELPKTSTGKIQKFVLRRQAVRG